MKFKKSLSLLLSAVMVAGVATVAAYAAESDSEAVGYSNQSYLENYANSAKNVNDFGATYTPSATTWKTWSPDATSVKVKLYNTGSDNEAGAGAIGERDPGRVFQGDRRQRQPLHGRRPRLHRPRGLER